MQIIKNKDILVGVFKGTLSKSYLNEIAEYDC